MIHNLPTCRLLTVVYDDSLDDIPNGAMLDQGLPHLGQWVKLGRMEEITEEVWKEIMPYDVDVDIESGHYCDLLYRDFNDVQQIIPSSYTLDTATESARSLITGNPVVLIERKKK
jgi:hypothetical protein